MPSKALTAEQERIVRSEVFSGSSLNEIAERIGVSKRVLRYYCLDNKLPVPSEQAADDPEIIPQAIVLACREHLLDLARYHRPRGSR